MPAMVQEVAVLAPGEGFRLSFDLVPRAGPDRPPGS